MSKKKIYFILCFLFAVFTSAFSQTFQEATGKVIAKDDGEAVMGASVTEKGTHNGTVTDLNGRFSFKVAPGSQITITYIGYKATTVKASTNMTIILEENAQVVQDVIVTGYATQKKADLTGSVAVVNVSEMKTVPVADPMQALQGKVAGMTITDDGSPSSNATIRIRGIGTMNDNDPLSLVSTKN
jgi:hypothetical protein